MRVSRTLLFFAYITNSLAWDSEQLEVFDVVDEVKTNFYDLLNISKDASSSEIRSAFRTLSLKLHPDKNLDTDTSEQFRNLVSIYDVLKNPTKRKYYDEVLVNGLPNWRSAVYYYRYVRKMGMAEACIILFVIVTVGQYIVYWAAYFERKFTIQENSKKKKTGRKGKNYEEEADVDIPKPSFFHTLPFQIPKLLWIFIISIPSALGFLKTAVAQQIEEATKLSPEPEPEPIKIKTARKRNKFVVPEEPNFETLPTGTNSDGSIPSAAPPLMRGGLWTDDDLDDLIRLVKKFPQGSSKRFPLDHRRQIWLSLLSFENDEQISNSALVCSQHFDPEDILTRSNESKYLKPGATPKPWHSIFSKTSSHRWESIAEILGRSIPEVTYMANKMKENGYRLPSEKEEEVPQIKIKQKTKKETDLGENVKKWSQIQQKALEDALAKYPKGCLDRWDKIADHVPGKMKEECMMRFKYLAETLKKQKESVDSGEIENIDS